MDKYGKAAHIGLAKVLIRKCKAAGVFCEEMEAEVAFLVGAGYVGFEEIEGW